MFANVNMNIDNIKIENTTRLRRCENCGKFKAQIKTEYKESIDITIISLICATDSCAKVFSTKVKKGRF